MNELARHIQAIESHIRRRFAHRLSDFRIELCENALELEGTSRSYHVKQIVQQAVTETTHLRIRANNIVVKYREQMKQHNLLQKGSE